MAIWRDTTKVSPPSAKPMLYFGRKFGRIDCERVDLLAFIRDEAVDDFRFCWRGRVADCVDFISGYFAQDSAHDFARTSFRQRR